MVQVPSDASLRINPDDAKFSHGQDPAYFGWRGVPWGVLLTGGLLALVTIAGSVGQRVERRDLIRMSGPPRAPRERPDQSVDIAADARAETLQRGQSSSQSKEGWWSRLLLPVRAASRC